SCLSHTPDPTLFPYTTLFRSPKRLNTGQGLRHLAIFQNHIRRRYLALPISKYLTFLVIDSGKAVIVFGKVAMQLLVRTGFKRNRYHRIIIRRRKLIYRWRGYPTNRTPRSPKVYQRWLI